MGSDNAYQQWWESTWTERVEALEQALGPAEPMVFPLSVQRAANAQRSEHVVPGACVYVFPLAGSTGWAFVTMGLTQPLGPEEVAEAHARGEHQSGRGLEYAILVSGKHRWAPAALDCVTSYVVTERAIGAGEWYRLAFGWSEEGHLWPFTGPGVTSLSGRRALASEFGLTLEVDSAVALVFAEYFAWPSFVTGTGAFSLLIGTAVSEGELNLVRQTTVPHVLLLLERLGVGQASDPLRPCALTNSEGQKAWRAIEQLHIEEVLASLRAGFA